MKKTFVAAMLSLALIVARLAVGAPARAESKGRLELIYVEWDCATAANYTMKALLERQGYEVEITPVSGAAMWQAIGVGDADALIAAWLPVTHADYYEKVKDNVENLGVNTTGAKIGWVVPQYVTIDSITQMNENVDKFDGKVIGIDPGAGLMKKSELAMKEYGLDKFELVEGSGATMTAALGNAIKNNEWVVVAGWSPHWKFGRWDLKYLEDPKGVFGGEETINTIVRKGLKEDMPEAYHILDNFNWPASELQKVMAWNQEKGADLLANAKRYLDENPDRVKEWLGQ